MKAQPTKSLISLCAGILLIASSFLFASTPPNDSQITQIIATTNDQEIELAKLAHSKTKNSEVKKLALQMINSHRQNNEESDDLLGTLHMQNQSSVESQKVKDASDSAYERLQKLEGKAFDRAYVSNQIKMHQDALRQLESVLIPSADNTDLRAHLLKTKAEVQGHLRLANEVQSSLL